MLQDSTADDRFMGDGRAVGAGVVCMTAFFFTFFFGVIVLSKNIYVGNLSWSTTDADLRSLFSQYGEVTSAQVIEDRATGRSRGFGFVEMDDAGAQQAIQALNGNDFQGRPLKVNEAQPRERRPRY
jgi:RNA recognition motif-containing protein